MLHHYGKKYYSLGSSILVTSSPEPYLLLASVAGAAFVVLVTTAASKHGTVVGGVLTALPLTGAWAVAIIGVTQGIGSATGAVGGYLLGAGVWFSFLLSYAILAKWGFWQALALAFLVWGVMTSVVFVSGVRDFLTCLAGGTALSIAILCVYFKRLKFEDYKGERRDVGWTKLVARFVGSFAILLVALGLSSVRGPFLGGLVSTAPIISSQIVYWTYIEQDIEFSRSVTKNIVLTGTILIIPYGASIWWFYQYFGRSFGTVYGIFFGTLCGYGIAAVGAYAAYRVATFLAEKQILASQSSP